jgi:hypothetical protein
MQRSEQPRAAAFLNLTLETKTQLRERYKGVPIFSSCEELLGACVALPRCSRRRAAPHSYCSVRGLGGALVCSRQGGPGEGGRRDYLHGTLLSRLDGWVCRCPTAVESWRVSVTLT